MDPYAAVLAKVDWGPVSKDAVLIAVALAALFVVERGSKMLLAHIQGVHLNDDDTVGSGGDAWGGASEGASDSPGSRGAYDDIELFDD